MRYKKLAAAFMAAGILVSSGAFISGCGSSPQQAQGAKQAIQVTTFKPFKSDTPIKREYTGTIMALQEVPVRSRVSGTVMEKYVSGGEKVVQGQPLFRLDTRNYSSNLAAAQASAAQASVNYENANRDLARYDQLIQSGAISQKAYDSQKAAAEAYRGALEAAEAQVDIASNNLNDAVVVAPFSGTLSMDDVNVGTYATAGNTALVTISSSDPLYVQFDMSENEYLALNKGKKGTERLGDNLKLHLSDGSIYGETGKIVQVNPNLSGGQLSMKASFPNPDGLLVPGMYASVVSDNEIAGGSLLIPTRALVQLLNKDIVDVVVDGKIAQKAVKVGAVYGIYTIIESGLDENDVIVVEGQDKVQVGTPVSPNETSKEALEQAASDSVKGQSGTAAK